MVASRRTTANFALQRAVEWCRELALPLLVFEALRVAYPWASDRLHAFVLQGMADNARRLACRGVSCFPYVEPRPGAGRGLLAALAAEAALVVTDEYPAFFLPRMIAAASAALPQRLEAVDANGLVPVQAAGRAFPTAYAFRRYLQAALPGHLGHLPADDPLADAPLTGALVSDAILARWPMASTELLAARPEALAALAIDHRTAPVAASGGTTAAESTLRGFIAGRLPRYAAQRRAVEPDVSSHLSPYLHFGHIGAHQVWREVVEHEGWSIEDLAPTARGARQGWWGMSAAAEAFVDQLVTWRELGFNTAAFLPEYERLASLPQWAVATLSSHAGDRREHVYTLDQFAAARTHDPLWNAAQRQLVGEGRIHNYLRMLWGKKILEWSASPADALAVMTELNNRFALDGRDPNSVSGIFWTLGRYDRPWFPQRPVFGTVRTMSSANTARKMNVKPYLAAYGGAD
jgi:deoxyribodipyrimidine photo-lyase